LGNGCISLEDSPHVNVKHVFMRIIKGVVILDKEHAKYLHDMEIDYNTKLKYFDTPEERDAFELTLKK